MSKNIIIAGGAGFIGSNLIDRLMLSDENQIYCIDNLSSGKLKNLSLHLNNNNFHFIYYDIINDLSLLKLPDTINEIYNFACIASPPKYQLEPIQTTLTSVLGNKNLLDLAIKYNATYLYASTSEVYGDPIISEQNERYNGNVNPVGPRSCYDEGKRCGETLCFDYYRKYNTNIKIIRIFNTYGPKMDINDGRVITNFIKQIYNNEPITIYGDGKQTRSFQYIDDLLNGIELVMNLPKNIPGPINLGKPDEFTILELAEYLLSITSLCKSKITFFDLPKDDPKIRKPDITLAKNLLPTWEPKITLQEGIQKTIEYFLKNGEITPKFLKND